MTPALRDNLLRLLKPRHIAIIGGRDAVTVAGECARIGFAGPIWPVNPKRRDIAGHTCFARIEDLPEPPDAVFLAVPREAAIDSVARLARLGAGGVVCYTAGFGEIGAEGAAAEAELVQAAGDMALVGPNCYGVINYIDRAALWPFAHGGSCPGFGAAIITQSGMLSSDLTMSQRSVPFAYMVSAGNQSVLRLEDFIEVLCERPEVRAIGLHIEGLQDTEKFCTAARKALDLGKPIVALKTGSSKIGARLTVSHTGSLSGTDDLYQALFERLGIIRVTSPAQLLETLKFLCVAGVPKGKRIAAFTCSGGGATMLADYGETIGLEFPQPTAPTVARLGTLLPETATVSNPLDYTTPIWGQAEKTGPVFEALMAEPHDAALLLQDYPSAGLDESKPSYLADARTFVTAAKVPATVCSTLPENLDRDTRDELIAHGVAPMQGLQETLNAIAGAAWFGRRRAAILQDSEARALYPGRASKDEVVLLDELSGKRRLAAAGIDVPPGVVASAADAPKLAAEIGFPVALKMLSSRLPHKSEAGAVRLGLANPQAVEAAVAEMTRSVASYDADAVTDRFLVERMIETPVAELLVNVRRDAQFGLAMTLASGGVLAELIGDSVTLLLPASRSEIGTALGRLKLDRLLDGHRGRPGAERDTLVDALYRLAVYAGAQSDDIEEIEINPLFVLADGVCAVDVLMRVAISA
jgi:acyl-CoA synthetase (NDP forming)